MDGDIVVQGNPTRKDVSVSKGFKTGMEIYLYTILSILAKPHWSGPEKLNVFE